MTALENFKAVREKRVEELTWPLVQWLSDQKRSAAGKLHMDDAVAARKNPTQQVKQFSTNVTVLEDEVVKGEEAMENLIVSLKVAENGSMM